MDMFQQFEQNGYVVIEELFWAEECNEMKKAAYELAENLLKEAKENVVFNTKTEAQYTHEYFTESNDKIRPFVEGDALDEARNFKVEPKFSLNKIGHALHMLHPIFRCYTFCDRVKSKCKILGFHEPAVVQSMLVFKNPAVSSEVQPHQDSTFLYTEPVPTVGFWIALEDATVENGCLWIAAGSHKSGVHRRLMRNKNPDSPQKLVYNKLSPIYPASSFRPVPVKKGSCIILHGHVVHMSDVNKTSKARPAYTFHIVEKKDNMYSADNWLQEGPGAPFDNMYKVRQIVIDKTKRQADDSSEEKAGPSTA